MHFSEAENGIWRAGVQKFLHRADEAVFSERLEKLAFGIHPNIGMRTTNCFPYLPNGILFVGIGAENPLLNPEYRRFYIEAFLAMRNPEVNLPLRSREVGMNLRTATESAQHRIDLQLKVRAHELGKLLRLEALPQVLPMIVRVLSKPILNPLADCNCLRSSAALQELECCFAIRYRPLRLRNCLEQWCVHRFRRTLFFVFTASGARIFSYSMNRCSTRSRSEANPLRL